MKELFILAMHPDLQSVELQTSHISIPIEVVMNKMIKDEAKTKVLDRNEKGIKKMKSESHFPK